MVLSSRRLFSALFFVSLFVLSARNVTDPDFGWHLRTGEYVVSTLSIPHTDFFSFTATGQPWTTHEWLAQVLMYLLYRLGGFGALSLFFALLSTIIFGLVYLRCEGQPYLAAFVVLLAAISAAPFWGARPHTISLLLTSAFLYILDRYRRERRWRLLLWLVSLMLMWANSHGSFALGPVLIAVYLGAGWVEQTYRQWAASRPNSLPISIKGKGRETSQQTLLNCHCEPPQGAKQSPTEKEEIARQGAAMTTSSLAPLGTLRNDNCSRSPLRLAFDLIDKPLAAILLVCVAAIVLNPNGFRLYTYPFETLGSHAIQTFIQEWQPPDFTSRAVQPFLVFLILSLVALVIARPRVSLASLILYAAFTYASLRASRQISIWVLIAAPLLAASVAKILHLPAGQVVASSMPVRRNLLALNWLLLVLFLLAGAVRVVGVLQTQSEAELEYFPVQAVNVLMDKGWKGPILNQYNWGGYLIWRLYPRERVFIDGRSDVYSLIDDFIVREYLKAYTASADWREPLDRYGVQLVLVEPDAPLAAQLAHDSAWKNVYADASAVIYKRE